MYIKRRRLDMRCVLCHDEELHHTIIECEIQGRKRSGGRPRNSYVSHLKKYVYINISPNLWKSRGIENNVKRCKPIK